MCETLFYAFPTMSSFHIVGPSESLTGRGSVKPYLMPFPLGHRLMLLAIVNHLLGVDV